MGAASTAASSKMEGTESSSSFMGSAHAVRGHTLNALEQRSGWSAIARNAYECVTRGVWGVSSVQSLFELTNSKPTKLALKAVPSEQLLAAYDVRERRRRMRTNCVPVTIWNPATLTLFHGTKAQTPAAGRGAGAANGG